MQKRRLIAVLAASLAAGAMLAGCSLLQNRAPVAAFVPVYNVDLEDPMVVVLDASVSTDPDGDEIVLFQWVFSDAITFPVEPLGSSTTVVTPQLRIRCPNEGQYTATLLVYDERDLPSLPIVGTITVPHPLP